jgi:hypothetical protein
MIGAMAETAFGVTYKGPALEEGRMAVRDLAPALLALGDLFADVSVLLYPDRKPVALNIQASKEGSFVLHLILEAEKTWDQVMDLLTSEGSTALVNLQGLVVGSAGLFALIKHLKGRLAKSHERDPASGRIRIMAEDGSMIEVEAEVLDLYQRLTIRKKTQQVVAPLSRAGVESIAFQEEHKTTVTIEAAEAPAFEAPEVSEVSLGADQVSEMVVSILSLTFVEGNKWRLSDGERTFSAAIEDQAFIDRVDGGIEAFRKGDMLRLRMRTKQSQRDGRLHTEYTVVEVIQHIPREVQLRLVDSGPAAAESG